MYICHYLPFSEQDNFKSEQIKTLWNKDSHRIWDTQQVEIPSGSNFTLSDNQLKLDVLVQVLDEVLSDNRQITLLRIKYETNLHTPQITTILTAPHWIGRNTGNVTGTYIQKIHSSSPLNSFRVKREIWIIEYILATTWI